MTIKLSKTSVKNAAPPAIGTPEHKRGYAIDWDDEIKGFGLIITNGGVKSYIVRARIKGKERRVTLGRASAISTDTARGLARAWLGKIAEGRDPTEEKQMEAASGVTLRQAMDSYCQSGRVRPSTQGLVRERFNRRFPEWLDLPLARINEDMVERRFMDIGREHPADANIVFRYFRAVWNFAAIKNEDRNGKSLLPPCPTRRLTKARLWKTDTRRKRSIKPHQFNDFMNSVDALADPKARLAYRFMLYTGCRVSEAASLAWDGVDMREGAFTFAGTKSRINPDHTIPMTRQTRLILEHARKVGVGGHVFGDLAGRKRKNPFAHETALIRKVYGEFGPHDLRRTFITAGKSAGVDVGTVKRLVNHSTKGDVTEGYDASTLAMLGERAQRIADLLDSYAHGANVVPLVRKKA